MGMEVRKDMRPIAYRDHADFALPASAPRGTAYHGPDMRIAMIASECEPWAKTGGLADVVDALSRALQLPEPEGPGHAVDVYLPWYRGLTPPAAMVP